MMTLLIRLLPFVLAMGCTYSVHQVQMGDFTPYTQGGKKLMVMKEQVRILDIATETHYVEDAYSELKSKCPNGDIVGVSVEFMTAHHFFHAKDRIYLKGRCLAEGGGTKKAESEEEDGAPLDHDAAETTGEESREPSMTQG